MWELIITYIVLFLLLLLLFFSTLFLLFHLIAAISGAPFAASHHQRVVTMLKLANIKSGQKIVDLGSGDGRILITAAKKHDIQSIGYEINPYWYLVSLIKIRQNKLGKRVKIFCRSYWPVNLSNFDIVFLFLIPYNMNKMEKKLRQELRPGTLVVSNGFRFNNWQPIRKENSVFLYRK